MAYRTTHTPDRKRLGDLLDLAAGDRKLREYARDAHIPHARLFEIKREGGPNPSINTLMRLVSPEANPRNGVTLADFLDAAGYEIDIEGIGRALSNTFKAITPVIQEYQEFKRVVMKVISAELEARGIGFEDGDIGQHHYFSYQPDMILNLHGQPVKSLWFNFRQAVNDNDPSHPPEVQAGELIGEPTVADADPARKIVIVVTSAEIFKALSAHKNRTSYRGNLSAILLDTQEGQILERVTLSTYDVGSADPLDIL